MPNETVDKTPQPNTSFGDNTNHNSNNTSQVNEAQMHSVRVKLPQFWPANPTTWFIQAEAQFQAYRITNDDTKYCLVIAALPPDSCDSIIDILSDPPVTNRYNNVKTELIKRHSISETNRLETLIAKADIGDRSPSKLLISMKQLSGQSFNDTIIKKLWLRKLPQVIHVALVAVGDKPLTELAEIADKIYEAQQNTSVFAITDNKPSVKNNDNSDFNARLSRIEAMISRLDAGSMNQSRSSNVKHSRSRFNNNNQSNRQRSARSHSRNRQPHSVSSEKQELCWYHRKFGDKATKCRCNQKSMSNHPN